MTSRGPEPGYGGLPRTGPKPLKFWPFLLVGLSAFAIAKISVHPRLKLNKDEAGWTLRYDYSYKSSSTPEDKGLELPATSGTFSNLWQDPRNAFKQLRETVSPSPGESPRARQNSDNTPSTAVAQATDKNTTWILDTGATSHMCTNQRLLHSYRELAWGQTSRGFSSANGQLSHLVGIGNVTLKARVASNSGEADSVTLTLRDVHFYPTKGVNLLSWSQLKRSGRAVGRKLRLVEEDDSSLVVVAVESGPLGGREKQRILMRFRLQAGLFVLDQPTET